MAINVTEHGFCFCLVGLGCLRPVEAVGLSADIFNAILFFTGPAFGEEHLKSHADFLPVIVSCAIDGEGKAYGDFSIEKVRLKTPSSLHHLCQPFDQQLWIEMSETCHLVARIGTEDHQMKIDGTVTLYNPISARLDCILSLNTLNTAPSRVVQLKSVPLGRNLIARYECHDPARFPLAFAYSCESKTPSSSSSSPSPYTRQQRHSLSIAVTHAFDLDQPTMGERNQQQLTSDAPLILSIPIPTDTQLDRVHKDPDNLSHRTFLKMEGSDGRLLEWQFMRVDPNVRYTLQIETTGSEEGLGLGPVQVQYRLPGLASGMRMERVELFKDANIGTGLPSIRINPPVIRKSTTAEYGNCYLFLDD